MNYDIMHSINNTYFKKHAYFNLFYNFLLF